MFHSSPIGLRPRSIHVIISLTFISAGLLLEAPRAEAQDLILNEVMSSNRDVIFDEDGETPDWVEILNTGTETVSLEGIGLSDDEDPFRWTFPGIFLEPSGRLLVFCSGKDRRDLPAHWETVIDDGHVWRYQVPTEEPPASWRGPGFDDSGWDEGPSGFGLGDNDDRTEFERGTLSVFVRTTFTVDDPASVVKLLLDVDFDDGFVAFLNGVEIARANIDEDLDPPAYDDAASGFTEPRLPRNQAPLRFSEPAMLDLLVAGENVLAVQGHNSSASSSDMSLLPLLTLGLDHIPAGANGPSAIIRDDLPRPHTDFKLSSEGETLVLTAADGTTLDSLDIGPVPQDVSRGRSPDATGDWAYFTEPTPELPNGESEFTHLGGEVEFSVPGGFYPDDVTLTLQADVAGGTIRVTTDGSVPTESSPRYQGALSIDVHTVVRARVLGPGILPTPATTHSYFIEETFTLPVVSISTDPDNFFDWQTGIYVPGPGAQNDFPHFGANFWNDWERPVHLELFEPGGDLGFGANLGAKIFGGWSRGHAQRSLSFFARRQYGTREINYQIFPDKELDRFEAFILRNSGNDWQNTHFRDAMQTSLLGNLNVDRQGYRPSIVFINGEYWGIMNLREKINEHFLASNHRGVDDDELDLLERNAEAIHGSSEHYRQVLNLLQRENMRLDPVYEEFGTMVDVNNFIDYQAAQIYYNNTDWPGNNIKYWRPRTPEGKWRWIIYDTDFGFGIWDPNDYADNTLGFALNPNGPNWPNPPWSTLMLRTLVLNDRFVESFVNRFATHLSTIFQADRVVARIDVMAAALEPEMADQRARWGNSVGAWRNNVQNMRNFGTRRVAQVRNHLRARFGLGPQATLQVLEGTSGGSVEIQGVPLESLPYSGVYYRDLPIEVTAKPEPGYVFTGWTGATPQFDETISLTLETTSHELSASFARSCSSSSEVVINEINYNASPAADPGDWVELHNPTDASVDLSGWIFRDEVADRAFTFAPGTTLAAGEYLVLCSDILAFIDLYPGVSHHDRQLGFSLAGGGEVLELLDAGGNLVDTVTYDDRDPWPEEADGEGATLALTHPLHENTYGGYWAASPGGGTPGESNDPVLVSLDATCVDLGPRFLRGDADSSGLLDIGDPLRLLLANFRGAELPCAAAADVNGDGDVGGTSDAVYLLHYLFRGGADPVGPFPDCGYGELESDAGLGCETSSPACR